MDRRLFLQSGLHAALAAATLPWAGWALAAPAEAALLQRRLQQLLAIPARYLQQHLPAIWQDLSATERQTLAAFLTAADPAANWLQDAKAGPLLKQISRSLYTGKPLPGRPDRRYDPDGGYCRQLLPALYKARLTCHGPVNFWQSVEGVA